MSDPIRKIVQVDVDDSAFKRFQELFGKYRDALAQTTGSWKEASEKAKHTTTEFGSMVAAVLALNSAQGQALEAQHRMEASSRNTAITWRQIGNTAVGFAKSVDAAYTRMLSWGTLLRAGILGGVGLGGLWGLERLAMGAAVNRQSAAGFGTTIGGQQAFELNFRRFVTDPAGFLDHVSQALADPTKAQALRSLGVDTKGDTSQVAARALSRLQETSDRMDPSTMGMLLQGYGLDGLVSVETLRRLRGHGGEFSRQMDRFTDDYSKLDVTERTARASQDMVDQLERAGIAIKQAFLEGLTPVIPNITRFSQEMTRAVTDWMPKISEKIKQFLEAIDGWVRKVYDWLGMDYTRAQYQGKFGDVGTKYYDVWNDPKSTQEQRDKAAQDLSRAFPEFVAKTWASDPDLARKMGLQHPGPSSGGGGHSRPAGGRMDLGAISDPIEREVVRAESNGRINELSNKGAMGPYQFTADAWKDYGNGGDPYNPRDAHEAYVRNMAAYLKRYDGDIEKALAAYNWGPTSVDRMIAANGGRWDKSTLPPGVRSYVDVIIHNATGGNAQASVSRMNNGGR